MYETYAKEMVKHLKQKFLIDNGFKDYFVNNIEDFDFCEPEKAVEEVLRKYRDEMNQKKRNVRRVRVMSGIPHEVVKILSKPHLITMRDGEGTVDKFYSVDVVLKKEYEETPKLQMNARKPNPKSQLASLMPMITQITNAITHKPIRPVPTQFTSNKMFVLFNLTATPSNPTHQLASP